LGGLQYNRIRNPWVGHDGRSGFTIDPDTGERKYFPGRGIGSNYWDLLPVGGDDMYATAEYYAATLALAEAEEAIRAHPGWGLPQGLLALNPEELRAHAAKVKEEANAFFWNPKTGRFYICKDLDGVGHDYGYTFLNLNAIWYGIASDEHARSIMNWLTGKRTVMGDTATGPDIYAYRFGPRASTRRNIDWYTFSWCAPESISWAGQVQDGGAVLGFSYFDMWARLKYLGADNAWNRLMEIIAWDHDAWLEGGYREYYRNGKHGGTLQGGGTAGGLGIDFEFYETSLVPAIVTHGFLGLRPDGTGLWIRPALPSQCQRMGVNNFLYRGTIMNVRVAPSQIDLRIKTPPVEPVTVRLDGLWSMAGSAAPAASTFDLATTGTYQLLRAPDAPPPAAVPATPAAAAAVDPTATATATATTATAQVAP
jgi:hypothetical protein